MPLVSQTFDQLLDFTRTTSGTFVGSNGLIQTTPASVNLLTWTQQFDNAAWQKFNGTITANSAVAPDETSTADTLTAAAGTGFRPAVLQSTVATVAATVYTASFYVRPGTYTFLQIFLNSQTGEWVNYTLSGAGTATANGACTASISLDSATGWYRITMTYTAGGTDRYPIFTMAASGTATRAQTWNTAGTETVFAWGAQLEAASAATTYTRNNGGVFPPRFDYDPVTLAPKGLLVEEQRTNLVTYSAQFDNAAWVKGDTTVTANATTSPDGTANADKLVETATNTFHYALQNLPSAVTTIAYTASVYVKAAERTWCVFGMGGIPLACGAWFNLSNGTVGTQSGSPSSATITAVGNGWWRLTITKTATSAGTVSADLNVTTGDGVISYAGTAGSGIFVWGAQLEAGAFATSYIPTVASQVTRTADQCSIVAPNFAPWYNQSEGSLVFEGSTFKPTTVSPSANVGVEANDGTLNNRNVIQYLNNLAYVQTTTAGSVVAALSQAYTASATDKLAYAYKTNDFAFARNGALVGTDTSGATPIVDRLGIGNYQGQSLLNGHIRSIRYYPTRLTNAQLQALTA